MPMTTPETVLDLKINGTGGGRLKLIHEVDDSEDYRAWLVVNRTFIGLNREDAEQIVAALEKEFGL